jgi:UDPglucose 6-dehydrogenase
MVGLVFQKILVQLIDIGNKFNTNLSIVKSVILSNDNRRLLSIKKVIQIVNNNFKNKNITFLGVTFKANTDDMRESSSISNDNIF